jgi:hypothetical protein
MELVWPDKPICHGESPRFASDGVAWRPPDTIYRPGYGYSSYRNCGYCGSIHPEDLMTIALAPDSKIKIGGSDWKYGYPHKFYIENIPSNRTDAREVRTSGNAGSKEEAEARAKEYLRDGCTAEVYCEKRVVVTTREFADRSETSEGKDYQGWNWRIWSKVTPEHGKFYSEHILDIADEHTRKVFCDFLAPRCGIEFSVQDGKLGYKAPYHGFQA